MEGPAMKGRSLQRGNSSTRPRPVPVSRSRGRGNGCNSQAGRFFSLPPPTPWDLLASGIVMRGMAVILFGPKG